MWFLPRFSMGSQPIQVLVIEDDPYDMRLVQEMLVEGSPGSFVVEAATTLHEGIQTAQEKAYDVILCDLTLPDSAGLDTVFRLDSEVPDTAIIVLTGVSDTTLFGVQAVQGGAQDYLVKGEVDSRLLRHSIRYAIERHEIEMRLRHSESEYRSLIDDVFDTSMVAVIILDADFRIVWCNEAAEIYFSLEREDILGRDKRLLIDEELKCIFADPDDYAVRLLDAYENHSHTDRFECHVLPDGNRVERWLEHWSQPIHDGMFRGGRIEQYTDITDRKMLEFAEQEQRKFSEALSEIAMTITSTLDLDEVLGGILSNLDRIVPHDTASITMIEDDHLWIARQRHSSKRNTQEIIAEKQHQIEYRHYIDIMTESRQPLLIHDVYQDARNHDRPPRTDMHAYLGAPILLQNQIIGYINLLNKSPHSFAQESIERLTAFARLAAIAIHVTCTAPSARRFSPAGRCWNPPCAASIPTRPAPANW